MTPLFSTTLQNRAVTISIAILGLLVIVVMLTLNIRKYENHLATADTVLLALAPVDPRGFMQGDYMTLRYGLEQEIFDALQPKPATVALDTADPKLDELEPDFRLYEPSAGYVIVALDNNNVGHFVRLADNSTRDSLDNVAANEMPIYYRIRHGSVQLATNAFFFQEGHAESFEAAKYGLFRVNDKGEPLLTELVDEDFNIIVGHDEALTDSESQEMALAE